MDEIIHIVDDDPSVRGATSFLLSSHGYATRIYASGAEFLSQADLTSGCVLLDLRMADMSGLQVLEELAEAGSAIPVIMLTGHADVPTAVEALRLGAVDFIQKPYDERDLIAAIERARATAGTRRRSDTRQAVGNSRLQLLSQREMQVLRGLLAGMTNKEMARRLDLSPRTVEMHRSTMMADLQVTSSAEAIRIAMEAGLTPLDQEGAAGAPSAAALAPMPVRNRAAPAAAAPSPLDQILPPVLDVLEGSTDCAILLDRHEHITFLNGNAIELLAAGQDVRGRSLWDLFPGADRTQLGEKVRRAADERIAASFEFYAPDTGRWFDVSIRPIPSGLQLFLRDLTAERTATAALRQSDERMRLAFEASGDGTWDWDIKTGRVRISRRFAVRLGRGDRELDLGIAEAWRLIHPLDREALKARLFEHLDGRADSYFCEYRFRSGDGEWQWNLDRGRVVARDPVSGVPTRMVVAITDISSVKAMRQTLAEAGERIKLAQESSGAGLWDVEIGSDRIRFCGRSGELFGLPPEAPEEVGLDVWKAAVHPEDLVRTMAAFDAAVRSGRTFSTRYRVLLPDGQIRWIRAFGKLAGSEEGRPKRMVGLNIDETEQAQSVEKLDRLQSDLTHVAQASAIGTMTAAMADELNQPLTAISNYIQGLKLSLVQSLPNDFTLAAALEGTEASAKAAGRIVRRISEKAALMRVNRQRAQLSALVRDAAQVAMADFEKSGIDLQIEVSPDADSVMVDRVQIQQVLANLIRNGARAMKGVERARLSICAHVNERRQVEVHVVDRGKGLPDEIRNTVFSPFRNPTRTDGIGLAACRAVVEAHGGRIWAHPTAEGGTSIVFTLESSADSAPLSRARAA